MSTDLRDHELGQTLDRAVRHIDPDPEARLGPIVRRGTIRRTVRWGAIGAALTVFVGAVAWGALQLQGGRRVASLDTSTWETYRDAQLGWSIAHPPEWQLQTFHESGPMFEYDTFRGALVANVDFEFRHPELENGATTAWDMRGLPGEAVVVQFQYLSPRTEDPGDRQDTPFPLSLDDARRVRDRPNYGAPQPRLFLPIDFGGRAFEVMAWFGPEASQHDRAIAERIVASISFGETTPEPTPPAREEEAFRVGNDPGNVALGEGGVWVTTLDSVVRLDPGTGEVVARIDLGKADGAIPGGGRGIAAVGGAVWVANPVFTDDDPRYPRGSTGGVARIDPRTNQATHALVFTDRTPDEVAVGAGGVWVTTESGLTRIDLETVRAVATVPIEGRGMDVAVGEGAVWVAIGQADEGFVAKVDPQTNRVVATAGLASRPLRLAVGEGAVWAIDEAGRLIRIDPVTARIVEIIHLEETGKAVAVGEGWVWVATGQASLLRIDPATNEVAESISLGAEPSDVAVGEGAVWMPNYFDGTVTRIVLGSASTTVVVPDLVGLTTPEADAILEEAGLLLQVRTTGPPRDGTIASQSPEPGTVVDAGTVVTVRARCLPAPCPSPPEGQTIYDPCTCAAR